MASPDELKAQLKELMKIPENLVCLDCKDKRPMWASLIVPPPGAPFTEPLGCFCCYQCSGAHRRIGVHICFVRSTNLDEWKEKEIIAMRDGGNELVNSLFEASLTAQQEDTVKPNYLTDLDTRSNFIYDKYQHRKWYSAASFKKKEISLNFFPPAPVGETTTAHEEDFFALRANKGADDFLGSGSNGNSLDIGEFHFDPIQPVPSKPPPLPAGSGDRSNLSRTLTRMQSRRQVLNDIRLRDIDFDSDSPNPKTKRSSQSCRHLGGNKGSKKSSNAQKFDDMKFDDPDTFDDSFDDPKAQKVSQSFRGIRDKGRNVRKAQSSESFDSKPLDGRANLMSTLTRMESKRQVLNDIRTLDIDWDKPDPKPKSMSSMSRSSHSKTRTSEKLKESPRTESRKKHRRAASRDSDDPRSGRTRRAPARNKSMDLVRRPDRSEASGRSKPPRERSSSRSKPPREHRRGGVNRTKSSDNSDSCLASPGRRSRSQSVKRRVRRSPSDPLEASEASLGSLASTASGMSFGSAVSREDDDQSNRRKASREDDDQSNRRKASREDDDQSSNRRRARRPRGRDTANSQSPPRDEEGRRRIDEESANSRRREDDNSRRREDESATSRRRDDEIAAARLKRSPKRAESEPMSERREESGTTSRRKDDASMPSRRSSNAETVNSRRSSNDESANSRRKDDESANSRRKDDESASSRRARSHSRSKRALKITESEPVSERRASSPSGTEGSKDSRRRRTRKSPSRRAPQEAPISVRRVIKDRNPRPADSRISQSPRTRSTDRNPRTPRSGNNRTDKSRSPNARKQTIDAEMQAEFGELLVVED